MERDIFLGFDLLIAFHFNSHAHVERDYLVLVVNCHIYISTHTLTWSVTLDNYTVADAKINFNSHAHVERDASQK